MEELKTTYENVGPDVFSVIMSELPTNLISQAITEGIITLTDRQTVSFINRLNRVELDIDYLVVEINDAKHDELSLKYSTESEKNDVLNFSSFEILRLLYYEAGVSLKHKYLFTFGDHGEMKKERKNNEELMEVIRNKIGTTDKTLSVFKYLKPVDFVYNTLLKNFIGQGQERKEIYYRTKLGNIMYVEYN